MPEFRPHAQCLVCKGKSAFGRYAARARMPFAQSSGSDPCFTPPSDVGARTVSAVADSIRTVVGDARIVVMGDFNAGSEDEVFLEAFIPYFHEPELAFSRQSEVKGSYRYRGIWETIDHILVSPALMDNSRPFHTSDGCRAIVAFPFMCEREKDVWRRSSVPHLPRPVV